MSLPSVRGSSVGDNLPAAESHFSTPQADGATRALDLADTPASHIRNVRCILELANEYSRNGLGKKDGSIVLDREAVADIENKLGAALALLDRKKDELTARRERTELEADAVALGEQLREARERRAIQSELMMGNVPRQSAPAFGRNGAR